MSDPTHLKRIRGIHKGSITRLLTYVNDLDDDSTANLDDLEHRLEHCKQVYNDFLSTENKLFRVSPEEESHMVEVEENYLMIVGKLGKFIRKQKINETITAGPSFTRESTSSSNMNAQNMYNEVIKLPKCHIPPFSGDYMQWQSFYDLFTSAVHRKEYLSQAQKLQYLKGLLQGDAEILLRHFSITDANYEEALKKLRDRYDRKRHTVNSFIRSFMEQPSHSSASAVNIRKLLDTSDEAIRGLRAIGNEAENRDPWLIHILLNKLDAETRALWARESANQDFPKIDEFFGFLIRRTDELETLRLDSTNKKAASNKSVNSKAFLVGQRFCCPICTTDDHKLFECSEFGKMPVPERRTLVREEKRCYNCLNFNHSVQHCRSKASCRDCKRRHHSMLHMNESDISIPESKTSTANEQEERSTAAPLSEINSNSSSNFKVTAKQSQVILPTAIVKINPGNGDEFFCRALLDSSSQESFVTEGCAQRIGMRRTNGRSVLTGLGDTTVEQSRGRGTVWLSAQNGLLEIPLKVQLLVISKITSTLPSSDFELIDELKTLPLADPQFNKCGPVDLLLGTEIYYELLMDGKLQLSNNLYAQNTKLGWTVAGKLSEQQHSSKSFSILLDIDKSLRKFWELEEIATVNHLTKEEADCEEHFVKTTHRTADGKFLTSLPFSDNPNVLGPTITPATSQLLAMEKRFRRNSSFKELYASFMHEYCQLGHMVEFKPPSINTLYYLPHHGVLKESSTTSKLRVVFNASFKSSTGKSLNDILKVGPSIQSSIVNILIRFRQHKFVLVGDVEKMYRQIWVDEHSAKVQNIVWRNHEDEPIKHYRLQTITYGTASASFIATRCLKEIAIQNRETYLAAAEVLEEDVYMDDLMTGCNSEEDLVRLRLEVIKMTEAVNFNLRKWASNSASVLKNESNIAKVINSDSENPKLLGLVWNANEDCFKFKATPKSIDKHTKRTLLSEASKIFDPLGWLAPVVVKVKIMFQALWLQNLGWDDNLPEDTIEKWIDFRNELANLDMIKIPRWLKTESTVELHGFSDSSKLAYAATIYARVKTDIGWSSVLIAAKTKVAPIKQISIPRLELMGALLLSNLINVVKNALKLNVEKTTLWTDSKIVLDWLSDHPRRWPTFIGNRTSEILQSHNREHWHHVGTSDNPADIGSRGDTCKELSANKLWWNGPSWLAEPESNWPKQKTHYGTDEEAKSTAIVFKVTVSNYVIDILFSKIAKYSRLSRVYAYIQRFVKNCRRVAMHLNRNKSSTLTREEIKEASNNIIRYSQQQQFPTEYECLSNSKQISRKSKILSLNPFLDEDKLIRVGGRISKSFASFNIKHPLILSQSSTLSKSIILDYHERYYHAGIELTLNLIRTEYWIIRGRDSVRSIIHKCVKCIRHRPKMEEQIMGDLPRARVEYEHPFKSVGVDYAGPFRVHPRRQRGQTPMKAYICIFVCLSTKAVHIEIACELTTESFLGALKRFVARRGVCTDIFSDNGTNFVGANNQLKQIYLFLKTNSHHISHSILRDQINWHFNPPAASHMGGIYEAAVKSTKTHLHRVVGDHILTLEEFTTLMTEIESVLNSRPLCAIKSERDIIEMLTPAHFLIGRPLTAIPEKNLLNVKLSPSARWEVVKKMRQHFWNRWHREYLTTLQSRTKWKKEMVNIKQNDIVIVKDENLPPNQWSLARVVDVHPGSDSIVRVVSIRTTSGIFKRPIHKLCRLPIVIN